MSIQYREPDSMLLKVAEQILQKGTLALCAVVPDVRRSYNRKTYACPIEQKYHADGPYDVGYVRMKNLHVFLPETGSDAPLPMVIMVNGTGLRALYYQPVFEHLASWGIIAVGNNDSNAWSGQSALQTLDAALACHRQEGNVLFKRIDTARIGIAGHSQGALGAINAAAANTQFKVLYAASCPQPRLAKRLNWHCRMGDVRIPTLMACGTEQLERLIAPMDSMRSLAQQWPQDVPLVLGQLIGTEHRFVLHEGDAYMTAWFRYWLCGDTVAQAAFMGENAEMTRNPRWQQKDIIRRNLAENARK